MTCPNGHNSSSDDYCDVCGVPMAAGPEAGASSVTAVAGSAAAPAAPDAAPRNCPNCQAPNAADALFCESCGYDFSTGTMPRTADLSLDTPVGGSGTAGEAASAGSDGSSGPAADTPAEDAPTNAPAAAATPDGNVSPAPETDGSWVAEVWIDPDWYAVQNSADPLPSAGLPEVVVLRRRSVLVGRTSRSRNITPEIDCESDTGVSRRQAQLTTDGTRWFVEDLDSANGTYVAPSSGPLPTRPITPGQRVELDPDDRVYLGAWTRIVVRPATDEEKAGS